MLPLLRSVSPDGSAYHSKCSREPMKSDLTKYPTCILVVLLLCLFHKTVCGAEATLEIYATFNDIETIAGDFTYDREVLLGSPFGQDFHPLTAFAFTSPFSGTTWTLNQARRNNGPAGYAAGPSTFPHAFDRVLAEVLINDDGTASGLGVLPFGSSHWMELSPFRDTSTGRNWREYFGGQLAASGNYRIAPEPTSALMLLSFLGWVVCGCRMR